VGPDFARTKFVYVYQTYQQDGKLWNRVVRMVEQSGRGQVDRVLLDRIPGAQVHDGGRIKFGPDGKLYITTGDSRQPSLAQDRTSLAGKILRINADGTIPPDNPFPNSPIYSIGNRNGQGLAWHPDTKTMFESEHGPSGEFGLCCHDELNIIEPGKNYGWPAKAGIRGDPRYVDPIAESGATATWAPSGILIPTSGPWRGSVLMACLRGVHLRRFVLASPDFRRVQSQEVYFEGELGRLRDVVQGPDGTIYLLTSNRDGRGRATSEDDRVLRIVFP
jgi:glucose/arabinose dehydrogenase